MAASIIISRSGFGADGAGTGLIGRTPIARKILNSVKPLEQFVGLVGLVGLISKRLAGKLPMAGFRVLHLVSRLTVWSIDFQ
jgi:hypothetical protein